jgi:hypothetical protein
MKHYWHIWDDSKTIPLERYVRELSTDSKNSLILCSAEESYPARMLIEKMIPVDSDGWPTSFGDYPQFIQNLKKLETVDIIIGSKDPTIVSDYLILGAVHSWSNFFLYVAYDKLDISALSNKKIFSKLFLSMNTKAKYHRCLLMDLLHRDSLTDEGTYSWHQEPVSWEEGVYNWQYWEPKKVSFDEHYDPTSQNRVLHQHKLPKEFDHSFLILVPETYVDQVFITEKTWHPILSEKPFISYAAPFFHRELENQGFELYTEIIDYSFDSELDFKIRAELIVKELSRLKVLDFNKLHEIIEPKLKKNKQVAINIMKNKIGVPAIAYQCSQYSELVSRVIDRIENINE